MKCDNVVWWWKVPLQRNEFNFMIFCRQMNNFIVKLFGQKGAGKLSKKPFIFQYDMPKSCKVMVGRGKKNLRAFQTCSWQTMYQHCKIEKQRSKSVHVRLKVPKWLKDSKTIIKSKKELKLLLLSVRKCIGLARQWHCCSNSLSSVLCGVVRAPLLSLKTINEALIDE